MKSGKVLGMELFPILQILVVNHDNGWLKFFGLFFIISFFKKKLKCKLYNFLGLGGCMHKLVNNFEFN